MAKYEFLQPKFTEGVLAKSLQGRSNEEFYHYGYKSSKNMIPVLSGPAIKRPGTNYIGEAKDATASFIPFFKDKDNTYILELGVSSETFSSNITNNDATVTVSSTSKLLEGQSVTGTGIPDDTTILSITNSTTFELTKNATATNGTASLAIFLGYLRVWSQDRLLKNKLNTPATYEYTTVFPWTASELTKLKSTQSGDIIFVCCPTKPPQKIFRTLNTTSTNTASVAEDDSVWAIEEFVTLDGPYTEINIWDESDTAKRFTLKNTTEPTELVEIGSVEFNTIENSLVLANHGLQVGQKIQLNGDSSPGWGNIRKNETGETATNGHKQTLMDGSKSVNHTDASGTTYTGTHTFNLDAWVIAVTSTTFQFSTEDGGKLQEFELVVKDPVTTNANAKVKVKKYVWKAHATTERNLTLYNNNNSGSQTGTTTYFSDDDIGRLIRLNPLMKGGENIGGIKWAWGIIKDVDNTGTNGNIDIVLKTELANTRGSYGTSEFRLGAFSDGQGYPHVAQIYQQRMVLAATTVQPSTIWLSETANFYSFAPTSISEQGSPGSLEDGVSSEIIIDSNALTFTLDSDTLDEIKWLGESKKLSMGTSAGIYMLYGAETDLTVTPFRFTINRETSFSATDTAPVIVSNALLYTQIGGKDVQSLELEGGTVNQWVSSKISLKGYDIIKESEIQKMVWQERPYNLIWFMMADGRLLTLSYDRSVEFQAWSEHQLGGVDTKVTDIEMIPTASHDQIWLKVERTIGGSTKHYVETLGRFPGEGALTRNNYVFSDSSLTKSIAGKTFTASNNSGDLLITSSAHGLIANQKIRVTTTANDLPVGLSINTDYYIKFESVNTFELSTTAGGTSIVWTDAGSGTHSWITSVVTSFDHLNGQTVQVYYGGMQHIDKVVGAGTVANTVELDNYEATDAVIGLPFDAYIETLEPSSPENQFSYTKRLIKAAVLVEESLGIQLEYNDLSEELLFRTTQDAMGRQIPLFSGIRKLSLSGIGWDTHNLKIVSNGPFPMQLNAVIIEAETGGS